MGRRSAATAVALVVLVLGGAGCSDTKGAATASFVPAADGVLTVAAALPAPGFWDGDTPASVAGGFEHDLAEALAGELDLELEVVDVPFDRIVAGDLGGADLAMAQITVTDERSDRLTFSAPYHEVDAAVLALAGTEVPDLFEARQLRWAALTGSTQADLLDDVVRPDDEVLLVADEVAAAAAVLAGEVDAALVDAPSALVAAGADDRLEAVARFETDERYGIAVAGTGGDADRNREAVDVALRRLRSDGTLDDLVDALDRALGGDPDDLPVIRTR